MYLAPGRLLSPVAGGVPPALDLNFMGGVLPSGITFTRASTADYTDVNGVAQTAAVNQPRLTAGGLGIEDAATVGAAEAATVSTLSPWYNASAGTVYVEFTLTTAKAGGTQVAVHFDDGAASANRIGIFATGAGGVIGFVVTASSSTTTNPTMGTPVVGPVYKVAAAFAANDAIACTNGALTARDTSVTLPTVTQLRLGHRSPNDQLKGYLRRVRYWSSRLPDATLQVLTS